MFSLYQIILVLPHLLSAESIPKYGFASTTAYMSRWVIRFSQCLIDSYVSYTFIDMIKPF